jgi:hypothetical protein
MLWDGFCSRVGNIRFRAIAEEEFFYKILFFWEKALDRRELNHFLKSGRKF